MSALQLSSGPPDPRLFVLTDEAQGVRCLFLGTRLASPGLRRSSSSYPKTGEDGYLLRSRLSLTSAFLPSCLRAPSATGPKVVPPTVAPRSLGPIFERGVASTPWAPSASRSATLRVGRRDGSQRSTVRAHLQKSCTPVEEAKFFIFKPLVRAQIIRFTLWREFLRWFEDLKGQSYPSVS